MKTIHWK